MASKSQIPNPKSEISDPSPLSSLLSPLFVIRTPTATVTDLGTEFGIEVKPDGGCQVCVLAGQVEMATQSGRDRLRLTAGSQDNAARVDAGSKMILKTPIASERLVRAMPNRAAPVGQKSWLASPVVKFEAAVLWRGVWGEVQSHVENRSPDTPLATHAERIRFTFNDHDTGPGKHNASGYREIDVFGSPSGVTSASDRLNPSRRGNGAKP